MYYVGSQIERISLVTQIFWEIDLMDFGGAGAAPEIEIENQKRKTVNHPR